MYSRNTRIRIRLRTQFPFFLRTSAAAGNRFARLGITTRYNLAGGAGGAFALTPSVSLGTPSHDYNFRGESALGRDLTEVRIGLDAGRRWTRY